MTTKPNQTSSLADLLALRNKGKQSIKLVNVEPLVQKKLVVANNQKELIWFEADENRNHYLKLQNADNNKNPWFRYIKKETQYSEFVMLTTAMAQELLDHIWTEDDGNRTLKVWLKDNYKRDILNGDWIPSDESIGIDVNGHVYNGRHRMTALVESEIEYPFYVTFNALEQAKFTVDSGAKRTAAEKLKLVIDTPLGSKTSSFCKALMNSGDNKRFTETEIALFASKWQPLLAWVKEFVPTQKVEVQAAIAKAYLLFGPEKIEPFCRRLSNLTFNGEDDPAKALYVSMNRARLQRNNATGVAYQKTINTLVCLLEDKGVKKLYTNKKKDFFEWNENWSAPKEAWWNSHK
jgi:uncharacterized protein (DUF427 family)